jgi:hypothetical protein
VARVSYTAQYLYVRERYTDLDALIDRYSKLQDRLTDGRFKLSGIGQFFSEMCDMQADGEVIAAVGRWRAEKPNSAGASLLESEYWLNATWKARGGGLANSVSPEGWQLFHERLIHAREALTASESYASANPLWYMQYMEVNLGLGVSSQEKLALYRRGIKAFPEFFPLHFAMIRNLRPEWNGSNAAIAAFIAAVVKSSSRPLQAEMYTRLWWYTDADSSPDTDIFSDMGASWPRMKEGFEALVKGHPDSAWIRSNYAAFACRTNDMTTFIRLRAGLGNGIDAYAFRSNVSVDVCDRRAAGEAI